MIRRFNMLAWLLVACFGVGSSNAQDLADPGAYKSGRTAVVVQRSGGGTFVAQVYYPAMTEGTDTPVDPSDAPYAGVVFAHGFLGDPVVQYGSTLRHFATHGYVVIAPQSYLDGSLPTSILAYSADLVDAFSFLEAATSDPTSVLVGMVDTSAMGYAGHSMGAATLVFAAASDARARMLAISAPAGVNPSAVVGASSLNVPTLILSGSSDGVSPVAAVATPMYDNIGSPRIHMVIEGGWHCGFLDVDLGFCDPEVLPRSEQLAFTRRNLIAFADLYLKQDRSRWPKIWGDEALSDPRVSVSSDSGLSVSVGTMCLSAPAGTTAQGMLEVFNNGAQTESYTPFVNGNSWAVTFTPSPTPAVAPGASTVVDVHIALPSDATGGEERHTWGVWVTEDGGTHAATEVAISETTAPDCNANSLADACETLSGMTNDCNGNSVPDSCDIASGTSADKNANGIPDECTTDCPIADAPTVAQGFASKNRFLSFRGGNTGRLARARITYFDLPSPFDIWNGSSLWVAEPRQVTEQGGSVAPVAGFDNFMASTLTCDMPAAMDWSQVGTVHVFHEGIIPGGVYTIQMIEDSCQIDREEFYSVPLELTQARWGDLVKGCASFPCSPPDGVVAIIDAVALLRGFESSPFAPTKSRTELEGPNGCVDLVTNISDVVEVLHAFSGDPYPFLPTAPTACDSACPNVLP